MDLPGLIARSSRIYLIVSEENVTIFDYIVNT